MSLNPVDEIYRREGVMKSDPYRGSRIKHVREYYTTRPTKVNGTLYYFWYDSHPNVDVLRSV